jgi:esterase
MELFFRVHGEGTPVVILHGLFGSSDNWLTVSKPLAESHKVYLMDLRNHGRSPHSEHFDYNLMVTDLKDFFDQQNLNRVILIGHSMGGKVAMNFSQEFPGYVKKLIVVDISPRQYPVHHDTILEALTSLDLRNLRSRQEADEHLQKFISEMDVRQFLLKNLYRNEKQEFLWRINLPVIDSNIEKIGDPVYKRQNYPGPVLFIRGGKSRYISDEDIDEISNYFTDFNLTTIEKAGHWVQAEAPAEFLAAVKGFIEA